MIKSYKINIMGTISFDAKFPKMRKAQSFSVYPMQDISEIVTVQSVTRFGRIDLASGKVLISATHSNGSYSHSLQFDIMQGKAQRFDLPAEDTQTLRQWIKSTGGVLVGSSVVKCENIGAIAL